MVESDFSAKESENRMYPRKGRATAIAIRMFLFILCSIAKQAVLLAYTKIYKKAATSPPEREGACLESEAVSN